MLEEKIVKLGPVRTRYFEAGSRTSPTVVLIHEGGFGGDALNTFSAVAELLSAEYHVLAPDMLGFGGTDKAVFFGENPYEPRLRHLAAFLDALDVESAHFVGNSFGGGIVLRMTMRPETSWRMRTATSISGTGGPFRTPEALEGTMSYSPSLEDARRLDGWVIGEDDEEHSRARFESSMRPGQWESMMGPTLRNPALGEKTGATWDLPHGLASSTVKTLLVAGTKDRMLEAGWQDKLAEHIPDVTVKVIDAGHSPNIDQPEITASLLREWFQGAEAGE